MPTLDSDAVLEAAGGWVWVPEDARTDDPGDYLLVGYPEHFLTPTVVSRIASDRPADQLVSAVAERAQEWGRDRVVWWVADSTRPRDLEDTLQAAGAASGERLDVLAAALDDLRLDAPDDVEVRVVRTFEDVRAREQVSVDVFGGTVPPDDVLRDNLTRAVEDEAAGRGVQVLALLEGAPVGAAGATLTGEFLRLWGGSVLDSARGRGVYRAMTSARVQWGRQLGAEVALVKGRVTTSGPILTRAGFVRHGEERSWLLPVSSAGRP